MRTELRTLGIVMLATVLLAGCGDNDNSIFIDDNGNDNTNIRTATPARTPTAGVTSQATPTDEPTAVVPTETPGPDETETPTGPTSTAIGPTEAATVTPTPERTATPTLTPSPAATSTAAAAFCGNGTKEAGEDCDTGAVFSSNADCAEQCACCRCRPDSVHASVPMTKCSTCHPAIGPPLTFPPGAAQTFPGLCE
jgi:hypothetical protein